MRINNRNNSVASSTQPTHTAAESDISTQKFQNPEGIIPEPSESGITLDNVLAWGINGLIAGGAFLINPTAGIAVISAQAAFFGGDYLIKNHLNF